MMCSSLVVPAISARISSACLWSAATVFVCWLECRERIRTSAGSGATWPRAAAYAKPLPGCGRSCTLRRCRRLQGGATFGRSILCAVRPTWTLTERADYSTRRHAQVLNTSCTSRSSASSSPGFPTCGGRRRRRISFAVPRSRGRSFPRPFFWLLARLHDHMAGKRVWLLPSNLEVQPGDSADFAGIFEPKSFFDIDDYEWIRYFEVNVLTGIRTARQYLPGMIKDGWGRVVFISSESALQILPHMMHYGATKTMQLGISRGLAEVTAGTGVTVNSVLPGPTFSEGVSEFVVKMGEIPSSPPRSRRMTS